MELDIKLKVTVAELMERGVWEEYLKTHCLSIGCGPDEEVSLSSDEVIKYGLSGENEIA
jgi:hypothetical protein